ncbi:MAG: membrane protein insertion efficiency factor YidD [Candidatus Nucleicultricaceae bacterium]|jgi:hypothetical protein
MKNSKPHVRPITYPLTLLVTGLLRVYKLILSPYMPMACRYDPTCSVYMMDAIHHHGLTRGLWLGLKRIGRCHPWGGHGYDPAPKPIQQKK